MGVGSSKKREEEKKKKEEEMRRKEAEEKLENARKDLQLKIDDLEKKIEVFQKKANNLHEKAKEKLANGDRNGAKKLLHKKKKVTEQIENINNAIIMLEDQLFTIENQEILGGITSAVKQGIEAITIEHVKDIITRIGKPEELTGEEEKKSEEGKSTNWEEQARSAGQKIYNNVRERTAGKKLYRNPKDKMLAGVMSGLAVYTNTDPVIWRLLIILFTMCYGVGIFIYIVLALVLPEAKTPEQLLQMEGKDVTPQNLADVVVEKEKQPIQRPNLVRMFFSFLLKICFAFFVIIALIVCIGLFIGFLFALIATVSALILPLNSTVPFSLEAMGLTGAWLNNPTILGIFVVALFLTLLIPIYGTIHMLLSLSGKIRPMGIIQRIVWIFLWVVAVCTAVPLAFTIADYHNQYIFHRHDSDWQTIYQGIKMSTEDADFLRQGDWNLIKAENCAHYTANGEHFSGDWDTRYLDAWNNDCKEVYQAERKENVEPGIYKLACNARAEGPGPCIYAVGDKKMLQQIPVNGNNGGAMGNGWSTVTIDSIVVTGNTIVFGVSTDESFTGKPCRAKWFSATDFELFRVEELK